MDQRTHRKNYERIRLAHQFCFVGQQNRFKNEVTGEAKPVGKLEIKEDRVKSFLNPLSIQKIPMLGDVTFQLLSRIGIRTIQTFSRNARRSVAATHW